MDVAKNCYTLLFNVQGKECLIRSGSKFCRASRASSGGSCRRRAGNEPILAFTQRTVGRIRGSLGRRRFDAEFDTEVETHLELLTERFVRRGMSPEAARYAARKQFGGVTQMKNELRHRERFRPLEAVVQDSATFSGSFANRRCSQSLPS